MRLRWIMLWLLVLAVALPASARILTTRPSPSETWNPLLPFTIAGGFEFETDRQESRYDFPLLVDYNVSEWLKLTVEQNFAYIHAKKSDVPSVGGVGDVETSVAWEFIRERRYRPALTLEGIVRWPTATKPDLGDPGRDYSLGLIASKDFVYLDVDLGLRYTSIGDHGAHDNLELTVGGEWPLNHRLSVLMESSTGIETGRCGRIETEGTVGLAWRVNSHLKLEGGGTARSDGTWQVIFAWEWNFAGED